MKKKIKIIGFTIATLFFLQACKKDPIIEKYENPRFLAGGKTTVFQESSFSFSTPATNLVGNNMEQHLAGDAAFEQAFVTAPASVNQGLGPVFNNNACIACHPKDGRAPHPDNVNGFTGFFLRASMPGSDINGGPLPVPGFGGQLAHKAVYGTEPEVSFGVTYTEHTVTYDDGETISLRKPVYYVSNSYISFPANAMLSPRVGPPVFGLGLLEAIPESQIIALADETDSDGDGISGKPNYVWNTASQQLELGRFGWKGINPTVLQQCAGAYNDDMGVTTTYFPVESSNGQTNGTDLLLNDPELSQEELDEVTFYCRTLGVPAPRDVNDPTVVRGELLFKKINCTGCHTTKMTTGTFDGIPEISNQTIYPFSDGLLHDMGFGLADNRPSFDATGHEWKTRPLWGIGLTQVVGGHTNFLHDGRARNLEEAIMWHGGEASKSISLYKALTKQQREAIITFLNSL
jgi:CxxC motif-containing protein (DUF1111 family)